MPASLEHRTLAAMSLNLQISGINIMPLPTIDDIMSNPSRGLIDASCPLRPVTTTNTTFQAKKGNATWSGDTFTIRPMGHMNYQFIPAVVKHVSYCVVPGRGHGDIYVISDQYGGCEYHELYHPAFRLLAFLHVYRGKEKGKTTITQYTRRDGWDLRSKKRSAKIADELGMRGMNWSVSHIDRTTNPPTVQSKFIHMGGGYPPNWTVIGEDDGDTPYEDT